MRSVLVLTVGLVLGAVVQAQSPAGPSRGYVEGVAQSAFGNVTSQSFGGELGVQLVPNIQVFIEAGMVNDAATADFGAAALAIAGSVSGTQSNVSVKVKEPVSFGTAGLRFLVPITARLQPYLMGGGGVARVSRDFSIAVNGTDVTNNLSPYGVVLGSDLSGSVNKPMLAVGAGVTWPVWQRLVVDVQYRYGRVFTDGEAININRAGIGVGVRF